MFLVGKEVAVAPIGADDMGVKKECGVPSVPGASLGTSLVAMLSPPFNLSIPLFVAELKPIPGSEISLSPRVRKLRHSGASGSSRHLEGIETKDSSFANESALFFVVTPFGRLGF